MVDSIILPISFLTIIVICPKIVAYILEKIYDHRNRDIVVQGEIVDDDDNVVRAGLS